MAKRKARATVWVLDRKDWPTVVYGIYKSMTDAIQASASHASELYGADRVEWSLTPLGRRVGRPFKGRDCVAGEFEMREWRVE